MRPEGTRPPGAEPILLLVDDERAIRDLLAQFARQAGYAVVPCSGGRETREWLRTRQRPADLALVDVRMPDEDGLEVLRAIKQEMPPCSVVLMSGFASIDVAVQAMKLGATDYLPKPLDFDRLGRLLEETRAGRQGPDEAAEPESRAARVEFGGMLGRSEAMQEVFRLIRQLAPYARSALVTGETGTGKELASRALHDHGRRPRGPYVSINCSAMVDTLFESELFGHMRGAFTGADTTKIGLFEAADRGTLFLDEVGELPLGLQAKLLRVLETGEVRRVGGLEGKRVDVQVTAATNRDLEQEVVEGRFRADLYFRLSLIQIRLPPLQERGEDVVDLAHAFVREFSAKLGKPVRGFTPSALQTIRQRPWPGNVRELRHAIERACILSKDDLISEADLALTDTSRLERLLASRQGAQARPLRGKADPTDREQIEDALQRAGGNKAEAARLLGISRRALYRRLEDLGLAGRAPSSEDGDAEADLDDDTDPPDGDADPA